MPRHGVIKFPEQTEEDRVLSLYGLLKTYDIKKKEKGFDLFKFILRYLRGKQPKRKD